MIKLCPDRKVTQVHKAMMIGHGDSMFEYFTECMKEKCVAYSDGRCTKYNNTLVEMKESEEK